MAVEQRVVFCPLPEAYAGSVAIERWEGVPPVSEDYGRARDSIVERLVRPVDEIAPPARGVAEGPVR
jgi:hypothetical protein